MLNKKNVQEALDFLTTYGWAFLVILVMIGALAGFGILDLKNIVKADDCLAWGDITDANHKEFCPEGECKALIVDYWQLELTFDDRVELHKCTKEANYKYFDAEVTFNYAPEFGVAQACKVSYDCN
jgi:hypothetical protein